MRFYNETAVHIHNTLYLHSSQSRLFWKLRAVLSRFNFLIHRELFGFKNSIYEQHSRTKSFFSLARLTLFKIILGILFAGILQFTDPYLTEVYLTYGINIPNNDDYGTLLATVAGIGGVLIGLYYAAISGIGGTIYSHVPNNVRDLLVYERIGNVYMEFLAFVTYSAVTLLALRAAGFPIVVLAIPFYVLASGFSLIAFVRLGARAFDLFDPTTLSHHLFGLLQRNYRQAMAGAYRWFDPSFQNHAHRVARQILDTLATLAEITSSRAHLNGQPFATLCKNLLVFLISYEQAKKKIPTESYWYSKRYVHPDWYRTSDTTTSLIYRTSSLLPHETVSNSGWLEEEALTIVYDCISLNLELGRYEIVIDLLGYIDAYVQHLSREHQVPVALQIADSVALRCEKFLFSPILGDQKRESLERLGIIERLASLPIATLIEYIKSIEKVTHNSIISVLRKINWQDPKGIYSENLPSYLLSKLEWLFPRLDFEFRTDENPVGPFWYTSELVMQTVCENTKTQIVALFENVPSFYDKWQNKAKSANLLWTTAMILSREAEFWNKMDAHLSLIHERWDDFNSSRRIEGLAWPALDFKELEQTRTKHHKRILSLMSDEVILLSNIPRPEIYPDFAGQFLHSVGEGLIAAMYDNDVSSVEKIFSSYFFGTMQQFEYLRPKESSPAWRAEIDFKVAVAPLLDLMDLSGYAFLYADYHNASALSQPIITVWDKYFDAVWKEKSVSIMPLLASAILLAESAFEIPHRSILRMSWNRLASSRLSDVNRKKIIYPGAIGLDTAILHESPLIRIFARDRYGLSYDGIDIFIMKYLLGREDGKDVNFGARRSRLIDAIKREEEFYPEKFDGE